MTISTNYTTLKVNHTLQGGVKLPISFSDIYIKNPL